MSKRITIVLNDRIAKKIRELQAEKIKKSSSTVSFSRVVNEVLEKGLE